LAEVSAEEGDAEDEVEGDSQGLTEGRMDIVIEKTFFHVREPDCARTSQVRLNLCGRKRQKTFLAGVSACAHACMRE